MSRTGEQIIISGVGGQGILFVTRLLAEAAIQKGLPVLTSETHGMAQRGGTVVSHFKVGQFTSPLIRPGQADGFLALKAENVAAHGNFLRTGGWAVVNHGSRETASTATFSLPGGTDCNAIDADALAVRISNPKSVNLIMLGFALAKVPDLFCSVADIQAVLEHRLADKPEMRQAAVAALNSGHAQAAVPC